MLYRIVYLAESTWCKQPHLEVDADWLEFHQGYLFLFAYHGPQLAHNWHHGEDGRRTVVYVPVREVQRVVRVLGPDGTSDRV
jgi:hypothetical protein